MVSDIVLLQELPDFIKNSVKAYIGCLSGAIMKDKYIETIKAAGFTDVKIIEEISFPIECSANDPTAQAIVDDIEIPPEKLKKLEGTVSSIKVSAAKPV